MQILNHGKKITLFLVDGEPDGKKTLSLGGWNGLGLMFPRNKLKELGSDENYQKPGIYFLFGKESEDSLVYSAYIGEAENIFDRLTTHSHDKSKDFWHLTVAFISTDDSLTKAHVKYLESRCAELANNAKHS
ncbi:MAG: GIY-YIG nuclease family protein [Candidatus Pacebacteria bacterium]|nr:GIY-YIG nuclease family protein [Candidatus Paceibacterota bacterium]